MTEKEIKIVLVKDEHGVVNNIKLTCECTIMDMLIGAVVLIEKVSECAKEEDMSLAEILVKHVQAKKISRFGPGNIKANIGRRNAKR